MKRKTEVLAENATAGNEGLEATGQEVMGHEITGQEVTGQEITSQKVTGHEVKAEDVVVEEAVKTSNETSSAADAGLANETARSARGPLVCEPGLVVGGERCEVCVGGGDPYPSLCLRWEELNRRHAGVTNCIL